LKQVDLGNLDILHISAHALVDDRSPDRSAVVLAPGAATEDGLLQVREIARLRLSGQLVTLASCQSALGTDVSGEGVLSVARAFLAAGAGTVIATLWPVEDAQTAEFFRHFYAALAAGQTVNASLQSAQIRLLDTGWGPEAWAGFVVLGNGGWHHPTEQAQSLVSMWRVLILIVTLSGLALLAFRYRS
jgi:CHAT domain-containing protein